MKLPRRRAQSEPPCLTEKNFRKLTDEESFEKYQLYMARLVATAKAVCKHYAVDAKDKSGHELHPCQNCVKIVRHVLELWAEHFKTDAVEAAKKMHKHGLLQTVQLPHAYEIGAAVLWPEAGRGVDGFGAL